MNKNINNQSEIDLIRFRMGYKINESPRYRPLIGMDEEFDELPSNKTDGEPPKPSTEITSSNVGANAPEPPIDNNVVNTTNNDVIPDPNISTQSVNIPSPQAEVDNIQNDIIKHNIEAMKSIHNELENLNNIVQGLNSKIEVLNSDVEEVREPTDSEKLMSKKNVSYPYYFNLNDFWSGNWFENKRNEEKNNGVRELPDGTFIADFDDLPKKSRTDIQNSFNEIG